MNNLFVKLLVVGAGGIIALLLLTSLSLLSVNGMADAPVKPEALIMVAISPEPESENKPAIKPLSVPAAKTAAKTPVNTPPVAKKPLQTPAPKNVLSQKMKQRVKPVKKHATVKTQPLIEPVRQPEFTQSSAPELSAEKTAEPIQKRSITETAQVEPTKPAELTPNNVAVSSPAALPTPVPASSLTQAPRFIRRVAPVYPQALRNQGRSGTVKLAVLIDASGEVKKVDVIKSAGYLFDLAAIKALKASSFSPAQVGDKAVAVILKMPIHFHLR